VLLGFELVIFAGVASVLFSRPLAAVLILVGFFGYMGTHLAMGVAHYRETMRRPWPKVPPLEDDDDEW
jgi:Zn-dependent protease